MAKSTRIFDGVGMVGDMPSVKSTDGKLTDLQVTFIVDSIRNLIRAVNGQLRFGSGTNSAQAGNIDGQLKEVTFANADTDYEVPHGLARVPIGIIVLNTNADGAVVRGASQGSWSDQRIFVRCNVAGTTALFVVV